MIEDDLRGVHEIAELRLPDHQAVRAVEAVAVFKAERAGFAERAVVNIHGRLAGREMLQRHERIADLLVVKNRVALAEGAAARVLPGQADAHARRGQRGEGEGFGGGPVERMFAVGHFAARLQSVHQLGMRAKSGGQFGELAEQLGKFFNFNAGVRFVGRFWAAGVIVPEAATFGSCFTFIGVGGLQLLLQPGPAFGEDFIGLFARDVFEFEQMFKVAFTDVRAPGDFMVEERLRERRLIGLIVAEAAVAIHVNEDVRLEFRAEIHRDLHDLGDGFRVFAVHMKDRHLQHPRNVGRINGRAAFARRRGETDLVVDDHMNHAADGIAGKLAQVEGFLDDAFAGKRRVAVNEKAERLAAIAVAQAILMRAHTAEHDGIHKLQMAWVEAQREMDFSAVGRRPIAAVAEVMFHVAASLPQLRLGVGEFAENFAGIFSDDVGQHVKPAAMSHADDDVGRALMAGFFNDEVEQGQKRFAAFE